MRTRASWRWGAPIAVVAATLLLVSSCARSGGASHEIAPLALTTPSLPDGMEGVAYSLDFEAQGGIRPYSWSLLSGPPPDGMTLSPQGAFSGTPLAEGTYSLTVEVSDSQVPPATAAAPFLWFVAPNPSMDTPPEVTVHLMASLQRGLVDLRYDLTDAESDPVTIDVEYSTDSGVTYAPTTDGPGGAGTGPLPASPSHTTYLYVWDSLVDTGPTSTMVRLRITPWDSLHAGLPKETIDFALSNPLDQGIFVPSPEMGTARMDHTATLLQDGSVLVAGGTGPAKVILDTAEIFSPTTGSFTSIASAMTRPRAGHTATLLPDGSVFIAGGTSFVPDGQEATTEIFDPATLTFQAATTMAESRVLHAAAETAAGVVITGGVHFPGPTYLGQAEVFDWQAGSFSTPDTLAEERIGHTATPLPNGRVLIAGGSGQQSLTFEEYDPATGTSPVSATLPAFLEIGRHRATALQSGAVLITGGGPGRAVTAWAVSFDDAYIYESGSGLTHIGSMGYQAREQVAARMLDGRVLIAGGEFQAAMDIVPQSAAVLFDPTGAVFTSAYPMTVDRVRHAAVTLTDGRILITGGRSIGSGDQPMARTERFHP